MEWFSLIFGRFHPLVVHFPVGILLLAFFFELASTSIRYRHLRIAVPAMLWIGSVFAIAAVATGLVLRQEGDYEGSLVQTHQILGIVTACLSAIAAFFYKRLSLLKGNTFANVISSAIVALFVALTGHWGGSLTHGENYLSLSDVGTAAPTDPVDKLRLITNIDSANFYGDVIQPILESRCYSCHSASKIKGDLRLDEVSYINKGGESGKVITPGLPDSSSLYHRMTLPLEHEDHMPPNQKPQPSSAEMALIQSWIQEGAHFEMKLHEFRDAAKIRTYFSSLIAQSEIELLIPIEEVEPADDNLLVELRRQGVMALPVATQSNFLSVSFVNKKTVSADDMRLLLPLKKQIVWLDLAYTNAGDTCLAVLTELSVLRKLNLQYTAVTNTGISSVAKLSNLVYLNLVGTSVTDDGVQSLAKLEQLKNLYLFETAVSPAGIKTLTSAAPGIAIDTGGYKLPVRAEDSADVFSSP